jgi:hypothetical protein
MRHEITHPLRCRCGSVQGAVTHPEKASRGVCYCRDCRTYAHALGGAQTILDDLGGTDVVATVGKYVTITAGIESLACMSLRERGLLRWYARCCHTPIANTPRDFRLCYVGLVHNCLEHSSEPLDTAFCPVRIWVNTKGAKGKPPSTQLRGFISLARLAASLLWTRLGGSYRNTPFFDSRRGTPVVEPRVLTASERERAMSAI